jgi:HAD superfamily hydrolase (TIGR01549 family)
LGFSLQTREIDAEGPLASAALRDEIAITAGALWQAGIPWYLAITIARESCEEAERTLNPMTAVSLLPGARKCIEDLRSSGLSLFIVTSDGHERTENMLRKLELLKYFDLIVGSDDVEYNKPDPEGVFLCSQKSGIPPQKLVVVGDTPQDALMGKQAGSKTIRVLTGVSSYEALNGFCDIVVSGVQEIEAIE